MSFAERGNKRSARRFRLIGVAASCELHHRMGDVLCRGNGSVHQCGARRAARGKKGRAAAHAKGDRLHVKLQLSDWNNLDAEISEVVACVRVQKPPMAPFEFLAISASPEDQLTCTKQCLADNPRIRRCGAGEKYTHDRIRIGYFSA